MSHSSESSLKQLPEAIFRFLDLNEINLALQDDESNLYVIMFSNPSLPFVVSVTHWARLGESDPIYHLKTTTARHQCLSHSVTRNPRTRGVSNDYLNPNTSSMKMIAWKCQGAGSVAFCNHAYELHRRHRPNILVGFVLGRRTSDNIILFQEVIRTLIKCRDGTRYIASKLDLEKAYDRLEWDFIRELLEFFQILSNLITLIMNMVSSTSFHILWNGSPLPEIVPTRGVR
nr:hypothetical protein CFP56_68856 [Quercus suber]